MRFVLFVGPKGSGKDASAAILRKKKVIHQKLSFAAPLKEVCATVFGLDIKYMNDPLLKEKPFEVPISVTRKHLREIKRLLPTYVPEFDPETNLIKYNIDRASVVGIENRVFKTPREMLQQIGTDFIRDRIYKNWHVEAAFGEKELSKYPGSYLYGVTDTRFLNEYQYLTDNFGDALKVYYVERPEAEEQLKKATHESELQILEIKKLLPKGSIIKNDGTLVDLEKKLSKLIVPKKSSSKKETKKSKFVYGTRNG